jgi:hypothetical protein
MSDGAFLPLIWYNGEIVPFNRSGFLLECRVEDDRFTLTYNTVCFATKPLFISEFEERVFFELKALDIEPKGFFKEGKSAILEEIRRLHIRNKAYGWVLCRILIAVQGRKPMINSYLLLESIDQAFVKEQMYWQLCILHQFPKPVGSSMMIANLKDAYLKLALREVAARGCHDGLVLGEKGQVVETCNGNIFSLKENMAYTPAIECGAYPMPGRGWIIDQLKRMGFQVEETMNLNFLELYKAEEVFVLGSDGIYAVKGLDTARYYDKIRLKLIEALRLMAQSPQE